jgi:hypothetical protein
MGSHPTSTTRTFICKYLSVTLTALSIAAICLWLLPCRANASDEWWTPFVSWVPVTDADWNPDLSWLKTRPDAVMIFEKVFDDERNLYYQEMGKQIYTRTRIYTERGKRNAFVTFVYSPKVDKITDIRARTVFPDGRTYSLTKNEILGSALRTGGKDGADSVYFTFPGVDTNCIVEYFISIYQVKIGNRIFTYRDVQVQKEVPLLSGEYIWFPAWPEGPDESYAKLGDAFWCWAGAPKEVVSSTMAERVGGRIRVFAQHVPAWTREPFTLPDTSTLAEIWRYYSRKDYPTDARDEIAVEYAKGGEFQLMEKEQLKLHAFADRFRSLPSQAEKIKAVYTWLQDSIINVNYYGTPPHDFLYASGNGTITFADYKWVTDALDYRYGTWRTIDALFCDILKDLGIAAYPMLMSGRHERVFVPQAGFFQYTKFIVAVKDSTGGYQFYTPGEWGCPEGMMHWAYEAADGIICSDPPVIARTTASPPNRNASVRNWSLRVRSEYPVDGTLSEYDTNHKGRLYKVALVRGTPDRAKQDFTDSLAHLLPGAKITLESVKADSAVGTPVISQATITYPGAVTAEAGVISLRPFEYTGDYGNPFVAQERTAEIVFTYAWNQIDTVRLNCGLAKSSAEIPADSTVVTLAGRCSVKYIADSGGVTAIREFTVNKPRFAVEEYPEVRNLFRARAKLSSQAIQVSVK